MKKVKGTIDRFEDSRAVVRVGGEDLVVPKKLVSGFSEGDSIFISITVDKSSSKKSREKAKKLLSGIFKEG